MVHAYFPHDLWQQMNEAQPPPHDLRGLGWLYSPMSGYKYYPGLLNQLLRVSILYTYPSLIILTIILSPVRSS